MTGFIRLNRSAFDHHLLRDAERFRAWFWMVSRACWKAQPFDLNGKTITLQRGQFCVSIRGMADDWGWSKSAVDRFLTRLETETMIERKAGQGRCIITICNYDKYQSSGDDDRDSSGTATGTAAGQQRDIKEEGNKGTIEEEDSPLTPQHTRMRDWPEIPDWMPVTEWNAFIAMRKRKARGSMPTAHAIGLIIGKLERWRASGQDPGAVLDQSTEAQWTGIFELKEQGNGRNGHPAGTEPDHRDGFTRAIDRRLYAGDDPSDAGEVDGRAVRTGSGDSQGHFALTAGDE